MNTILGFMDKLYSDSTTEICIFIEKYNNLFWKDTNTHKLSNSIKPDDQRYLLPRDEAQEMADVLFWCLHSKKKETKWLLSQKRPYICIHNCV